MLGLRQSVRIGEDLNQREQKNFKGKENVLKYI